MSALNSSIVAVARPRPYRRLLTSALHTRFVHASALVLLICWNHAFFFSDKKYWYFWSWFPLGPAGLRMIFIYMSALFVFILHVGSLKIGKRQSPSPFDTLRRILFSPSSVQPFLWYTASAIWFSEVYIWCSPEDANLGWIERGGMNTPDKLNERPIYLRAVCMMLAVFQSWFFLYMDLGSLKISVGRHRPESKSAVQDTHPQIPIKQQLQENGVSVVIYCAVVSAATAALGPFIYNYTVRQWLWKFHLAFAKLFWNLSRANARASGFPPSVPGLIFQSCVLSFLLILLWMATSIIFSLLLDQEPVKKTLPLSIGSKDPNGTLLNGLNAKKDVVKTFAFWELALISEKQPDRRRIIFADIERPEGPCWASMQTAALKVVEQIYLRIAIALPSITPVPPKDANSQSPQNEKLPSIAPRMSTKQIVLNPPNGSTWWKEAEALIAAGPKRIGQSAHPWSPPVKKVSANLYVRAQPAIQKASRWRGTFDRGRIATFFTQTNERKINATILGAPQSQSAVIVDAVSSVTKMLVASLSEDAYGKVNKGVPEVVKAFTQAISSIETFVQSFGKGIDRSQIEDVLVIHALLKNSLAELLSAFQMYLADVGLGVRELEDAKNVAQKRPLIEAPPSAEKKREMEQPQQRRKVGERKQKTNEVPKRLNGQAAGSRRLTEPAAQHPEKERRPTETRVDEEEEEEEVVEMPWSDTRRKLFTSKSPPTETQNWLGNSMYNANSRQRRGFEVDSPA